MYADDERERMDWEEKEYLSRDRTSADIIQLPVVTCAKHGNSCSSKKLTFSIPDTFYYLSCNEMSDARQIKKWKEGCEHVTEK